MLPIRNLKRFFFKSLQQPGYAAKVFFKRTKANYDYQFRSGTSSSPESLTLFLTHRCNLNCRMCGQWGENGVTKKEGAQFVRQELPLDTLKLLLDEISAFKPSITLFGGEPLLYPEVIDLIRYIKSKDMHCLMITNGSLLEPVAEQLVEAGLDELNVSLDAGSVLHDKIRGMPGLFETIMRGLTKIREKKAWGNRRKPLVNLQCTITKYNYQHLEQLIEVAKLIEANSLTYHNLIFLGKKILDDQKKIDQQLLCDSKAWEGFLFEPEIDPKILHEKIKSILSAKYPFNLDFYPNFSPDELKEYYEDPCYKPHGLSARCLSPWLVGYIFPDGQLKPCLNCSYSYGNIKDGNFLSLWNNPMAIKYRQTLKENGTFPVCTRCTELYRY